HTASSNVFLATQRLSFSCTLILPEGNQERSNHSRSVSSWFESLPGSYTPLATNVQKRQRRPPGTSLSTCARASWKSASCCSPPPVSSPLLRSWPDGHGQAGDFGCFSDLLLISVHDTFSRLKVLSIAETVYK